MDRGQPVAIGDVGRIVAFERLDLERDLLSAERVVGIEPLHIGAADVVIAGVAGMVRAWLRAAHELEPAA